MEDCMSRCVGYITQGCAAVVWVNDGNCFLKTSAWNENWVFDDETETGFILS
jgi:hypothetical protein